VKAKLLANNNTDGLKINVDTNDNVVTLRGTVQSDEIRDLAEALAQNTESVKSVENKLEVMDQ
jgi:hyperosmotically inducible protein